MSCGGPAETLPVGAIHHLSGTGGCLLQLDASQSSIKPSRAVNVACGQDHTTAPSSDRNMGRRRQRRPTLRGKVSWFQHVQDLLPGPLEDFTGAPVFYGVTEHLVQSLHLLEGVTSSRDGKRSWDRQVKYARTRLLPIEINELVQV